MNLQHGICFLQPTDCTNQFRSRLAGANRLRHRLWIPWKLQLGRSWRPFVWERRWVTEKTEKPCSCSSFLSLTGVAISNTGSARREREREYWWWNLRCDEIKNGYERGWWTWRLWVVNGVIVRNCYGGDGWNFESTDLLKCPGILSKMIETPPWD